MKPYGAAGYTLLETIMSNFTLSAPGVKHVLLELLSLKLTEMAPSIRCV